MSPPECPTEYVGPERRKRQLDRRSSDECLYHEAHEVRFEQGEKKSKIICHNVEVLKESMDTKVPNKLFYATAGGVFLLIIIILGVQWGTYEKVNAVSVQHAEQMGSINVSITEVKSEIKSIQRVTTVEKQVVKDALERNQRQTKEALTDIKKTIQGLHDNGIIKKES